jgi:aspartyl-tRNA(Asn)/glutamyl-tRNA(Gln) amidotransferase subunit C
MSTISKKDVEHVANLARLSLNEQEVEKFTKDLDAILGFVAKLDQLDTEQVPPTSHVLHLTNVVRPDEIKPSLPVEEALKNTAAQKDGQVQVPSVLES